MDNVLGLGERLRMLRTNRKMTLQGLAEKADCSVPLISKVERNESGISVDTALKLARALNVKVGVLLGEDPLPAELFTEYLRSLSSDERFEVETKLLADRIAFVLRWLGGLDPVRYSLVRIAKRLDVAPQTLSALLEDRSDLGSEVLLDRLVELTGIPKEFFTWGFYPGVTVSRQLTPVYTRYGQVIEEAANAGIPPEFLRDLIRSIRKHGLYSAIGLDELSRVIQVLGRQ